MLINCQSNGTIGGHKFVSAAETLRPDQSMGIDP